MAHPIWQRFWTRGAKESAEDSSENSSRSKTTSANAEKAAKGKAPGEEERAARKGSGATKKGADEGWFSSILITLVLFVLLRSFLLQSYKIPSESMGDTLMVGDYLMATPTIYGPFIPFTDTRLPGVRKPRHGDVVVFRPLYNNPVVDVVKRVIGEPGDTIEMRDALVYRNGILLTEPYIEVNSSPDEALPASGRGNYIWHLSALPDHVAPSQYNPTRDNWGPLIVPEGEYLLLGDNRDMSLDSRYMGFIPGEIIRGKVLFLYYSIDPEVRGALRAIRGARWERIGSSVE